MSWDDPIWSFENRIDVNYEDRARHPPHIDELFRSSMEHILGRLRRTHVGRTLLSALPIRTVVITPKTNYAVEFGRAEWAEYAAAITVSYDPTAATAAGQPRVYSVDDPSTPEVDERSLRVPGTPLGTGRGSPSAIYWGRREAAEHAMGQEGVMVHELTHVLRNAYGASTAAPLRRVPGTPWEYDNIEEYLAQAVANMYLVEIGRHPLVGHEVPTGARTRTYPPTRRENPVMVPPGPFDRQKRDLARYREYDRRHIREFYRRAPRLRPIFARFATLPPESVRYNPFRDADRLGGVVVVPPVVSRALFYNL